LTPAFYDCITKERDFFTMSDLGELLRECMRRWPTGVSVVTSRMGTIRHGMTVNSFASVSLDPPMVVFTLASITRTHALVLQSGAAGISVLSEDQAELSDRFAGRIPEDGDRFDGLATFELVTGAPLLVRGLAHLDCRVHTHIPLENSTLFLMDVVAARLGSDTRPLIYFQRGYHKMS
jgi:flavin reductase (DIM6/NTAB) family NADH-FMN oxidoreductase RutF